MIYIKIPAPSYKELSKSALWYSKHIDYIARSYVEIIDKQLASVSGMGFDYDCVEVDIRGIHADINPKSLMTYSKACKTYKKISIKDEVINRIAKIHKIDDSCPIATHDDLKMDFSDWNDRWLTVYIWVLLGAKFSQDNMWWTEQMVLSELISDKDLVKGLISKVENSLTNWVA